MFVSESYLFKVSQVNMHKTLLKCRTWEEFVYVFSFSGSALTKIVTAPGVVASQLPPIVGSPTKTGSTTGFFSPPEEAPSEKLLTTPFASKPPRARTCPATLNSATGAGLDPFSSPSPEDGSE